ncbi:MAG TPA: protein translocase subunit SecD [Acidimicrobiales bacterium]|nr:protein translocase subunit SecD [Acidimicrobiales bacterium]
MHQQRRLLVTLLVTVGLAAVVLVACLAAGWSPKLGLDLAGGAEVIYQPAHPISSGEMNTTVSIITNRVNALGASGATVQSQGNNVVVQLPGVKNPNAIIAAIGRTAQLYFRPVLCLAGPYTGTTTLGNTGPLPQCGAQYQTTAANLNVQPNSAASAGYTSNNIGPDPQFSAFRATTPDGDLADRTVLLVSIPSSGGASQRYVCGPAQLTGTSVASAQAVFLQSGEWAVEYTLTANGAARWDQVAQQNFHAMVAIDLDAQVQSAPIIQPTQSTFSSFQGKGQISGNFTEAGAKNLALALNYGALPVRLVQINKQTVSPSLGKSSLKAGLAAGIGGLVLVLIYMLLYYRALGFVVICGLVVTGAYLWAIISALGRSGMNLTLDLAGVTGLILSIGITVDSYVIYFERLKDEARSGRSVRTSVGVSFTGAFRTILAADLVSMMGAIVLWLLAAGEVRGFAFMLGLATLMNIVITYFFTRPFVMLLGRSERFTQARRVGVAKGLAVESGAG